MGTRAGRRRRGGPRRSAAALVVAACVAACTSEQPPSPAPSPSPPPSESAAAPADARDRIAVIVGPSSHVEGAEADAFEAAADELAASPPDDIGDVRVVRGESAAFTADLVELFVGEGYDVVCIVGSGAARLLADAARRHRGARFCGTDAAVEGGPANVVAVVADPVGLGTLAAAAVQGAPPPVGLVVGPEVGSLEVVESLMVSLLPTPVAPSPSPSSRNRPSPSATPSAAPPSARPSRAAGPASPTPSVTSATSADSTVDAAIESVVAADPAVVVLLAPRTTDAVAELAADGTRSVVVDDWVRAGESPPGGVLVALTVDRAAQLRAAIASARQDDSPQVSLLRLADGVLGVVRGPAAGSAPAVARVRAVLDEVGG